MFKKNSALILAFFSAAICAEAATSSSENSLQNFWLPKHGRALATGTIASNVKTIGGDEMLPVYGNHDGFTYADFMGDYGSNNTYLVSPGLGYRRVVDNQILGGYLFGDYEKTNLGTNFWVISPGIEWMTPHWDAHINGYFPTSTEQQSGSSVFLSTLGDPSQVTFDYGMHNQYDELLTPYAVIGNGADAELGYSFAGLSRLRMRAYVGGYYYQPPSEVGVDNILGVTGGFEQPLSTNLKVSLFNSYDQLNHYVVGIGLTATLGQESTVYSNTVYDRLLDPVERHVGIIDTGAGTYDQEYLKNDGPALQYTNVYFMQETTPPGAGYSTPETVDGDGTYGNPMMLTQTNLDTIYAESPGGARIYLPGGTYLVNEGTTLSSSSDYQGLFVYSGQDFYGRTDDYTAPASANDQPIISVDAAHGYDGFIVSAGENTFSDLTITEYSTSNTSTSPNTIAGIVAINDTTDTLTLNVIDSNITGLDSYGVLAKNNNSGALYINATNSTFNGNGVLDEAGVTNQNGAGILALNNYDDAGANGILVITAVNSEFNDNGVANGAGSKLNGFASGIAALNGNGGELDINVTNSQFNNNGVVAADSSLVSSVASGVLIVNTEGTSNITATNSQFNNNGSATGDNSSTDSAGILAENFDGSLHITAVNSTFNDNGLVSGNNSFIDGNAAGIDAENNENGTLTINATDSQFNNNGTVTGTSSYVTGYASGMYLTNESSGTITMSATRSQFNNNGIGTIGQIGAGLIGNNAGTSTGTLLISNLMGSSFNNNGQYGIYGSGLSVSTTTINETGATFSGNTSGATNQTGGDYINWISE